MVSLSRRSSTRANICWHWRSGSPARVASSLRRPARSTSKRSICRVITDRGVVHARDVVVATHFPILDRGLFFARVFPRREYAIAVRAVPATTTVVYISSGEPTRLGADGVRGDLLWLILGGEKVVPSWGRAAPRRTLPSAGGVRALALWPRHRRVPLVDPGHLLGRSRAVHRQAAARLRSSVRSDRLWRLGHDQRNPHIKRIHEYKRQLLNILEAVATYADMLDGAAAAWSPRVKIFAGKAAPSYMRAKLIIKFINDVAAVVNARPEVARPAQDPVPAELQRVAWPRS